MGPISFPGLGINNIRIDPTAFKIGSWPIAWYGIIIAVGLLLAMAYGMRRAPSFGISVDDLSDVIIFGIIFGIIGARLYYVLFYVDPLTGTDPYFSAPLTMLTVWKGGLGIYGGVIGAFASALVVCKLKKISTGAVFDLAALGFAIGQGLGRWGNFVNQEAYGGQTSLPWGMKLYDSTAGQYITVHPCFLYESLWCLLGFALLHTYSKKHRRFNGEIFLMYTAWYAFGRFFIEWLRSDSLMLGNLKISMLVATVFFIASVSLLIYKRSTLKGAVESPGAYHPLFEDASKAMAEAEENEKEAPSGEEAPEAEEKSVSAADAPEAGESQSDETGGETPRESASGEADGKTGPTEEQE